MQEPSSAESSLLVRPIGVVRSPFTERMDAPRQPAAAIGVEGRIELFAQSGIEHALEDLDTFRFIWIVFWFHRNQGFRPKVRPPRSARRRGVFATRAPYRPNPIGLSVVELLGLEGRVLRVRNIDMLDGTPVLDIKPYVPYADVVPGAGSGWLESGSEPEDPVRDHLVEFSPQAAEQLGYLAEQHGIDLRARAEQVLKLGPSPHAYRRIKRDANGYVLALKEWRLHFEAEGRRLTVTRVRSGFRPSELFAEDRVELATHRAFVERFG